MQNGKFDSSFSTRNNPSDFMEGNKYVPPALRSTAEEFTPAALRGGGQNGYNNTSYPNNNVPVYGGNSRWQVDNGPSNFYNSRGGGYGGGNVGGAYQQTQNNYGGGGGGSYHQQGSYGNKNGGYGGGSGYSGNYGGGGGGGVGYSGKFKNNSSYHFLFYLI
jgi:hypothetical protein